MAEAKKTKKASPKAKTASKGSIRRSARRTAPKKAVKTEDRTNGAIPVLDLAGKTIDQVQLDPIFNDGPVNTNVIYQAVLMYQANSREGTASTKDRGHVRGGGKKPWRQKGTGQARHGSRRSPIWRGGGTTFGPMPRDYSYLIPARLRRKAVVETVKDKVVRGKLMFVKDLAVDTPKTRLVAEILKKLKLAKPLIVVDKKQENLMLAARNLSQMAVKSADEVNAFDVVSHDECVMTSQGYAGLVERLKKSSGVSGE